MFSTDGILGRNHAIAAAALDGLAQRQQLHAENLANIDTEGYRAKTVDFERVLGAAMKGDDPGTRFGNPFGAGSTFHSGINAAQEGGNLSSAFATQQKSGKSGKVDRTEEVSAMMNDNIRFRVLTQQVTNQISAVRSVIAEMGRG
ncbi:MAG: flagellar basal-body rod protein FlgB [Thermoleophilia bacterium]|nr:flagellar basal-body rod protein FlgB [Thermoleophilia bacterium]